MAGFGLMIEELDSGAVRIALRGELDLAHAYTFDEELRRVEESRPSVSCPLFCPSNGSGQYVGIFVVV